MLKLVKSPQIKLNLYFEDKLIFESIDFFQAIDIRAQIVEMNLPDLLSGYYFKIDSPYWYLYDKDAEIGSTICNICSNGVMEDWFPEFYLDEEYGFISTDGEKLKSVLKLASLQNKKKNESIHRDNKG